MNEAILDTLLTQLVPGYRCRMVGKNGAGKSTRLKQLAGIIPLSESDAHLVHKIAILAPDVLYLGHENALSGTKNALIQLREMANFLFHEMTNKKSDGAKEVSARDANRIVQNNADTTPQVWIIYHQILPFPWHHTVEDQIAYALSFWGLKHEEIDRPCLMLSRGQQRLVALCRFLLSRRPLWVMDEPFVNLDNERLKKLYDLCWG